MPDENNNPTSLDTSDRPKENHESLPKELIQENQDVTPQEESKNTDKIQKHVFFESVRKTMTPLSAKEQETQEQEKEYKLKARHSKQYYDPLNNDECQLSSKNVSRSLPKKPALLSPFNFHAAPKSRFENNLPLNVYQPFLQEFFALYKEENTTDLFVLTGSAAKQLQNPNERNPNDIDMLLKRGDFVEGTGAFKTVVAQIKGASVADDDHSGTLIINYHGRLLKVQLIDYPTSRHCFPIKEDMSKLQNKGAIVMLDASIIPQKEVLDTEENDFNSEIEIDELSVFKF